MHIGEIGTGLGTPLLLISKNGKNRAWAGRAALPCIASGRTNGLYATRAWEIITPHHEGSWVKKNSKFFFKKIEPEPLLVQHIKGQPAASTYVREKGGITFYSIRKTPCRSGRYFQCSHIIQPIVLCSSMSLAGCDNHVIFLHSASFPLANYASMARYPAGRKEARRMR